MVPGSHFKTQRDLMKRIMAVLVLSQAPDGGREGAAPVMKSLWTEGQNPYEITRQAGSL